MSDTAVNQLVAFVRGVSAWHLFWLFFAGSFGVGFGRAVADAIRVSLIARAKENSR